MSRENIRPQEEPLDEEERQLIRELEAGEWVSDPDFASKKPHFEQVARDTLAETAIVTDTFLETISALETTADELQRVRTDPYRWKWVILALHSVLQGMMVLALEGSNGLNVLKPKDKKRWLKAYENDDLSKETEKKPFWMDEFSKLYEKIKSDAMILYMNSKKFTPQGTQEQSVTALNRLRNRFIHFIPSTFILALKGLPEMTLDCLSIARFLARDSNNIGWQGKDNGDALRERAEKAFGTAAQAAREMKEAYALPPPSLSQS